MAPTKMNLINRVFGRLTVLASSPRPGKNPYWLCACSCGKETIVRGECLRKGSIQSCGCYAKEVRGINATKHGASNTPEYLLWARMLRICSNPETKSYHLYGAKGIKVCERWSEFANFFADMGTKPSEDSSVGRINKGGDFEPSNCHWIVRHKKAVKIPKRIYPDITGQTFDKLTAVSIYKAHKRKAPLWILSCTCGGGIILSQSTLRSRKTQNCGCSALPINGSPTHGMSRAREYYIWNNMRERCAKPNNLHYARYGGRGIKVCDRWSNFANFITDMGRAPDGYSIDRLDNDGNYEPSNCKWIPIADQAKNKSTNRFIEFEGKRLHLAGWARELNTSSGTLKYLLDHKKLDFPTAVALIRNRTGRAHKY